MDKFRWIGIQQALRKFVTPISMLVLLVFLLVHFFFPSNTNISVNATPSAFTPTPTGNQDFDLRDVKLRSQPTRINSQLPSANGQIQTTSKRKLLSLRSDGKTVRSLLNELSFTTGVVIHANELKLDNVISVNFVDVALEDILLQLLRDYDVAILYKRGDGSDPQVVSVSVIPRDSTDGHALIAQSGAELVHNEDKQILQTSDRIAQYLADPDELHRARALDRAMSDGIRIAPTLLAQLVQTDGSALVRFNALSAIGMLPTEDLPGVEFIVVAALNDSDEATRLHAQSILNSMRDRTR